MHNCVTEDYFVEKKTRGKHDFQNNSLRFDMHKIVTGIEQKKIVGAGQSLVTTTNVRRDSHSALRLILYRFSYYKKLRKD